MRLDLSTRKTISKAIPFLNDYGKDAVNEVLDTSSDFQMHSDLETIARRFYADTEKIQKLYHYTNMAAFSNVISNREYYMGSIYSMNDPLESKYTYDLAIKILEELGGSEKEKEIFINDYKSVKFDTYVWSFSENAFSQALLNYGEIALGFTSQDIQVNLASKYTKPGFKNMIDGDAFVFPLKVEYNSEVQKEYITSIMKQWLNAFRGLKDDMNDLALGIRLECLDALFLFSLCFKRHVIRQEEEVRYVLERVNSTNTIKPDKYFQKRPVSVATIDPTMLKEVVVSHKAEGKMDEIKTVLKSNGFENTQVRLTDLPY